MLCGAFPLSSEAKRVNFTLAETLQLCATSSYYCVTQQREKTVPHSYAAEAIMDQLHLDPSSCMKTCAWTSLAMVALEMAPGLG